MTPEQEEQVRRALAATARADGDPALPPEVAARLDRVLRELEAPRVAAAERDRDTPAPADELAARRRRLPDLLVAAAAVSVIAVTGGAVATGGFGLGDDQPSDSTAGSGAEKSDSAGGSGAESSGAGAGSSAGTDARIPRTAAGDGRVTGFPTARDGEPTSQPGPGLPRLGTETLRRDVQRLLPVPTRATSADPSVNAACPGPVPRPGERRIVVRLDGRPATLVLGAPADGTRVARVYACGETGAPAATTRVRER